MRRPWLSVPVAGIALIVAGCGGDDSEEAQAPATSPASQTPQPEMPSADTGAELTVRSPAPGAVVTGRSVPFRVGLSKLKVDCRFAGTPNRSGVGHYHVMLDGALVDMFCRNRGRVSLQNVKPGKHELMFVPAVNDHTGDMNAAKKVAFTYRPSSAPKTIRGEKSAKKPAIEILSPKPGATVRGSFVMRVAPRNFELSCGLFGKPDVDGYGHWHANVDSTKKGMMGMATMLVMSCKRSFRVSLAGIKPGKHTFYAVLADNQHAPTPKAQDTVRVNVRSRAGSAGTLKLSADAGGKLRFTTSQLEAKAGQTTIAMKNPSSLSHNVAIEGPGIDEEGEIVRKGGTSRVSARLKPGTYTYYCSVPGHRDAGMQGTLTVK